MATINDVFNITLQIDNNAPVFFADVGAKSFGGVFNGWQVGGWFDAGTTGDITGHGFSVRAIDNNASTLNIFVTDVSPFDNYTGSATLQQYISALPTGWVVNTDLNAWDAVSGSQHIDDHSFTAVTPAPGLIDLYSLQLQGPFTLTAGISIAAQPCAGTNCLAIVDVNMGHDKPVPGPELGAGLPGAALAAIMMFVLLVRRRKHVYA